MNESTAAKRSGSTPDAWYSNANLGCVEHFSLYWRLIGARARAQMQYKFSFALLFVSNFAFALVDFLAVLVIFSRIPHLAGWSLAEVAFLYGFSVISFSLAEMFSAGFDTLPRQLIQGTFDRVLTRPLGALFQVLANDFALRRCGKLLQGSVILIVAQQSLNVDWSLDRTIVVALALVSGVVIFFSLFVIGAATCFWTVQANEAVNLFTNGGTQMISYPLDIYNAWLRRFATFVVPLAFVNYYPALYVLGRPDPLDMPWWTGILTPLAGTLFAAFAWAIWTIGVRRYQSVGS